jgi:hypothetical protein
MLHLNLISEEQKKQIQLRRLYNLIKKASFIIITLTFVLSTILLFAKLSLQNNFNRIVDETTLVTKNNQNYNNKVKEVNGKLKFVAQVQEDFIPWSYLLADLASSTPEGLHLTLMRVDHKDDSLKIRGSAETREDLLKLKKYFDSNQIYEKTDFPLKNILEKENIDFEISTNLKISEYDKITN